MTVYNMCWFLSKISSTRRLEEKNRQDEQTLLKREEEPKWEGGEVRRRKATHRRIDSVVSDDGVVLPAQVILALGKILLGYCNFVGWLLISFYFS